MGTCNYKVTQAMEALVVTRAREALVVGVKVMKTVQHMYQCT